MQTTKLILATDSDSLILADDESNLYRIVNQTIVYWATTYDIQSIANGAIVTSTNITMICTCYEYWDGNECQPCDTY